MGGRFKKQIEIFDGLSTRWGMFQTKKKSQIPILFDVTFHSLSIQLMRRGGVVLENNDETKTYKVSCSA